MRIKMSCSSEKSLGKIIRSASLHLMITSSRSSWQGTKRFNLLTFYRSAIRTLEFSWLRGFSSRQPPSKNGVKVSTITSPIIFQQMALQTIPTEQIKWLRRSLKSQLTTNSQRTLRLCSWITLGEVNQMIYTNRGNWTRKEQHKLMKCLPILRRITEILSY